MLDSETKRRIDSARDILVGKVPDPKSQVEQITIALIYKFMDDMDRQSIEMGGKASFFKGEFKKYGWGNIFDPRLGGVEMLNLYGEAITRMSQNANLPELFRNIFKNAYLPYRDPETLKLFLKTINDFTYDHSEKLGDAFEYLLSVLGSQGDAGQFRTPRHIIDFMVQVVDPKKNETVLDPACGTAGFLISAYKHILKSNEEVRMKNDELRKGGKGSSLTAQEKQKLYENFTGYDISPDMVRLSLVNLYLHGFVKPQIHEYDSLASEERWNEYADVILANPPFMSPKGGIMPHKKFSVQSNRSEVLFVDYMAEHLTPNGRAAIIVPEGIIFQSAGAYKQLRKYLIEHNFLWAVVSLPAGAFNPYSGVKTSILFLDKSLAKKTDKVLFVKVENDGFDLGAQRRPIDKNDLPQTLKVLKSFRASILDGKTASFAPEVDSALLVSISKLTETGEYNLSADRYRDTQLHHNQKWSMVKLEEILDYEQPTEYIVNSVDYSDEYETPVLTAGKSFLLGYTNEEDGIFTKEKLPVIIFDDFTTATKFVDFPFKVKSSAMKILKAKDEIADIRYVYHAIQRIEFNASTHKRYWISEYSKIEIPLPPLEIQRQLVDEIAAHQHVIDGARQVVENWKPDIELELAQSLPKGANEWKIVTFADVCEITSSIKNGKLPQEEIYIGSDSIESDTGQIIKKETIGEQGIRGPVYYFEPNVILYSKIRPNLNKVAFVDFDGYCSSDIYPLKNKKNIDIQFLKYYLLSSAFMKSIHGYYERVGIPKLNREKLFTVEIPLPPLEIQREIVARIETERAIVHGNRELIRLYEEKVKKVIERVWEG
ncbi:MAG: N-6 DNA methylase [Chloroflexi bacterium]|nr:N-6 DNA methylase [Chloroflexota bacterium]